MHEGVTVNWGVNWRGSLAVYRVSARVCRGIGEAAESIA
jgi:hypothetical protein